jgi:hypothetical protein
MSDRILQYLPGFYREIEDFVELDKTESAELDAMESAVQQMLNDQFVMTASAAGIKRREKMLGIQANPATESLEFRRARIINRYSLKPPFTSRFLQEQLDRLVGPGRTLVEVDPVNFLLTITVAIQDAELFREVEHTVKQIKPANIVYQQNTALNDNIELVETVSMQQVTWNYELGSWRLGEATFATLGPEVPVK